MALGDINAMANINQQTKNQRNEFAGNTLLGANRTSSLLFTSINIDDNSGIISIDNQEINSLATNILTSNYTDQITGNPDFVGHGTIDYEGTETMMGSVASANDGPSIKGPNLVVPSIDSNGEAVIPAERTETITSPVSGRGFGVNLDRHVPGNSPTIGSYLARRRDEDQEIQVPKGEYVDETKYDWEA